jgi:hypothetical protein
MPIVSKFNRREKMRISLLAAISIISFIFIYHQPCLSEDKPSADAVPKDILQTAVNKASVAIKDRQSKIEKIKMDYAENKISLEEAKARLLPLVKEELKDYMQNLDNEISILKKRLQFLEKGKQDSNYLVEVRTREILGEVSPQEMNYW